MNNLTLYSGITKESWDTIWKNKQLLSKETNATTSLEFALDYSYSFKTGKYEDLAIEIKNIPLEAFVAIREEDYEDDDDYESLKDLSNEDKIKHIESNSLFLLDLAPFKDIIQINLIDKNIPKKNNKIKRKD
jgi:hypothetical protein